MEIPTPTMEQARSRLYLFFAGVFGAPPSREFLDRLLSRDGRDHLAEVFPDHPALDACRELAEDLEAGRLSVADCQVDFEGLLRVPGPRYVQPYESVYRGNRASGGDGKARLLAEPACQVAQLYQEEGFGPAVEAPPFPDELAVELEFMGRLCDRAAVALAAGDCERAAAAAARQDEFLREHLLLWTFTCLETITERAETPLYRVLASLLAAFLKQEEAALAARGSVGGPDERQDAAPTPGDSRA